MAARLCHAGRRVMGAFASRCTPRKRFLTRRRSGLWWWFIGEEGRSSREIRRNGRAKYSDLDRATALIIAKECPCLDARLTIADQRIGGLACQDRKSTRLNSSHLGISY